LREQKGLECLVQVQEVQGGVVDVEEGTSHSQEVLSDVKTVEAKVESETEVVLVVQQLEEVVGNVEIESGDSANVQALQVLAEDAQSRDELVEEEDLDLGLASLLEEDPLGELGHDCQLLLDQVDVLRLADESLISRELQQRLLV